MSMFAKFMLITTAFLATAAVRAETARPEAYDNLVASPQRPGRAPRLMNGVSDLSSHEHKHQEHLPLQLEGAIKKVKKAKYVPTITPKREAKAAHSKKAHIAKTAKPAKRASEFKVEAMVAPAKAGRSKTHPIGFQERLPMPNSAPVRNEPVAHDVPDHF